MGNKEQRAREEKRIREARKNQGQKKRLPCENGRHRDAEFPCMKNNC